MKMHFPAPTTYVTAALLAAGLAVAGLLLYPLFAPAPDGNTVFALGLGLGALCAVPLAALRFETAAVPATEGGAICSIFVGNLAFRASREDLERLFGQYGTVRSVRIMTDRVTRRPRGFGFVEMEARGAAAAIRALDGKELHGRQLKVNEGNDRRPRESQAA